MSQPTIPTSGLPQKPHSAYAWKNKRKEESVDIPGRDPTRKNDIWHRHLTANEASMALCAYAFPGVPDIICSVQVSLLETSLPGLNLDIIKAAVRELRFEHPAIAIMYGSLIQPPSPENVLFAYEVPSSEQDVEHWLSSSVFDRSDALHATSSNLDKAVESVTHDLGTRPRFNEGIFRLHFIPSSSSHGPCGLVFCFGHAVVDATGAFQLMDMCIAKIAQALSTEGATRSLAWGEEVTRLPAAFSDATKIPWSAERVLDDDKMVQKVKDTAGFLQNTLKIPIAHPQAVGSNTGYFTRTLPPDEVASIHQAARAHNSTIFSVLWAVMTLTALRLSPPEDTRDLSNPCLAAPMNLRYLADDPNDKSRWSVRMSLGVISYVSKDLGRFIHPGLEKDSRQLAEDVWVLAREIREQIDDQRKHSERAAVWTEEVITTAMGLTLALPPNPTKGRPYLSSLGVVDKYLDQTHPVSSGGEITVNNPRLHICQYITFGDYTLALHPFTWKGELIIPFTFPEAAYGTADEQIRVMAEGQTGKAPILEFIDEFVSMLHMLSNKH